MLFFINNVLNNFKVKKNHNQLCVEMVNKDLVKFVKFNAITFCPAGEEVFVRWGLLHNGRSIRIHYPSRSGNKMKAVGFYFSW